VVDAHPGAHPWPAHTHTEVLRLAEHLTPDGALSAEGSQALITCVGKATSTATQLHTEGLLAFATSAIREAHNGAQVLTQVRQQTGVDLQVLSGPDEARMTFLAVRRWFGWSAGRILALDIGGGSLELAAGLDEDPAVALSLPLGAGRLTRERLTGDPPRPRDIAALIDYVAEAMTEPAKQLREVGWDSVVGTSKTLRSLARLAGAAPSAAGPWAPRGLTRTGVHQVLGFIRHIPSQRLADLDGVSSARAHQLLAGAVVAETAMTLLGLSDIQICPWALREGIILDRLDGGPL
jgi:exopolyphosphatase/guanosine-5'-triphosphate,3'-diphosphate pyrophosphatase